MQKKYNEMQKKIHYPVGAMAEKPILEIQKQIDELKQDEHQIQPFMDK